MDKAPEANFIQIIGLASTVAPPALFWSTRRCSPDMKPESAYARCLPHCSGLPGAVALKMFAQRVHRSRFCRTRYLRRKRSPCHAPLHPTHFCLTRVHREPGAQPVRQLRQLRPLRAAACTTLTRHAPRWRGPTARVIPRLRHRPRARYWRPLAKGAGWLHSLLRSAAARPQPPTPAVALAAHPSPTAYRRTQAPIAHGRPAICPVCDRRR